MVEERRESTIPTPLTTGMPAQVGVVPFQAGTPDSAATLQLLQTYWQDDGFHCPSCPLVLQDPNAFVEHLAEEINSAMLKLARTPEPHKERR